MDGTTAPYKEDLSKAQKYSDAVKQHDLRVRKHAVSMTSEESMINLFITTGKNFK